jgi:hypothetical protein
MFKVDFDAVIGGKINDNGWLSWPDPNGNTPMANEVIVARPQWQYPNGQ